MVRRFGPLTVVALAVVFSVTLASDGRPTRRGQQKRRLITQEIDETRRITLRGNTRHEANRENDRGRVPDHFRLEHMLLQLRRPPAAEQALDALIDELHDHNSPDFHQWLTAVDLGQQYGLNAQDLKTITDWLESQSFQVNVVYPNGILIDFSGTAAQIRKAFGTEIHKLDVRGAQHFANMSDPQIPAALAPAIVGIVSLHDFKPHRMLQPRAQYTISSGTRAVVPADLATIYNLNPLFSQGYSGQGQTIVVVEDTNVFSTADWTTFRSTFGLSAYTSGSFTQVHPPPPSGPNNCINPGVTADDGEAILDAEYASAAAPNAAIELASCANVPTYGILIALQNLLNESPSPPAIVSISYGACEAGFGAASNAAFFSAYQQAASEGVSVFVSSGDEGAASCDAGATAATHGIGVSALASTVYNVAVGGTDFSDTYTNSVSTFWNATNTAVFGSAKSYIPEIPWNDSCASLLIANFEGFATTYGSSGFCNNPPGSTSFRTTASGSGGPSGCATGTPMTSGVVSGTCAGYAKPSWQSGLVGNPSDGVRDIPDVSLFAANGVWGHYYIVCYSDVARGGHACTGAPSTWSGFGGTSISAPIMAGIQALVNQKWGRQGNPNPVYYAIAASEYGGSGNSACNSSNIPPPVRGLASACTFYDVTLGDMDVNCTGTNNCYRPSGTDGVLSTSNSSYAPAFGTQVGWDFATGIGTVNAYNLVNNPHW